MAISKNDEIWVTSNVATFFGTDYVDVGNVPTFFGTDADEDIYETFVSPSVSTSPPGSSPSEVADNLHGGGGADWLDAGGGDDWLSGGPGKDTVIGDDGDDWVEGNGNIDHLYGNSGNDKLVGGSDADYLYGGPDNDWLAGGPDRDNFYGGSGADTFYFYADEIGGPNDVIWDFEEADKINLEGSPTSDDPWCCPNPNGYVIDDVGDDTYQIGWRPPAWLGPAHQGVEMIIVHGADPTGNIF